jgi:NADH-quinone oxidoreductase subunit L
VAVALCGIFIAYALYLQKPQAPHALVRQFPWLYKLLYNKYYVDEIYNAVFVNPMIRSSEIVYKNFDLKVIDGTLNGSASAANWSGKVLSYLQTGFIKDYALIFLVGIVIVIGFLLF